MQKESTKQLIAAIKFSLVNSWMVEKIQRFLKILTS